MKQEIKFRAWDKSEKFMYRTINDLTPTWISVAIPDEDNGHLEQRKIEDVILMQYTGLKDKQGKEIYEGDIVQEQEVDNFEVIFRKGCFCYKTGEKQYHIFKEKELEVIGNIYENANLLK